MGPSPGLRRSIQGRPPFGGRGNLSCLDHPHPYLWNAASTLILTTHPLRCVYTHTKHTQKDTLLEKKAGQREVSLQQQAVWAHFPGGGEEKKEKVVEQEEEEMKNVKETCSTTPQISSKELECSNLSTPLLGL
ncbi:putative Solute carrier family 2 protein, partial [Naja naja]